MKINVLVIITLANKHKPEKNAIADHIHKRNEFTFIHRCEKHFMVLDEKKN